MSCQYLRIAALAFPVLAELNQCNEGDASPSLHWLSSAKTGKARAAIRRYWQDKSLEGNKNIEKNYSSTIEVDLPHKPGALGNICHLIGLNKGNIINVELVERKDDYYKFSFNKLNINYISFI